MGAVGNGSALPFAGNRKGTHSTVSGRWNTFPAEPLHGGVLPKRPIEISPGKAGGFAYTGSALSGPQSKQASFSTSSTDLPIFPVQWMYSSTALSLQAPHKT